MPGRSTHRWGRRGVLRSLVSGSLLLPGLVGDLLATAGGPEDDPLAARPPHFAPRAKRVIFLYMSGGLSHLESFDPKPRLAADAGKLHKGKPCSPRSSSSGPRGDAGSPSAGCS